MRSFYNLNNIFNLLHYGFDMEELMDFCFLSMDFRPVYDQWANTRVSKKKFIRELISFAERQGKLKILLALAREENPNKYLEYRPYFNLKEARGIAIDEFRIQDNIRSFFNLPEQNPEITIYLSRHSAAAQLPRINDYSPQNPEKSEILGNIRRYQLSKVEKSYSEEQQIHRDAFAAVSAAEILAAVRLKDELEKSRLRDLFPEDVMEELQELVRGEVSPIRFINVSLAVCPMPDDYDSLLTNGTSIFVGGPRANLGTYLYLYGYGRKAGIVRPRRIPKNVVECISDPASFHECDENHNLAIIQKHHIVDSGKTVFYLAGTGVNGTSAAVAYLRQSWLELLDKYKDEDFFRIIKVPGGKVRQEIFVGLGPEYGSDQKWEELEFMCE